MQKDFEYLNGSRKATISKDLKMGKFLGKKHKLLMTNKYVKRRIVASISIMSLLVLGIFTTGAFALNSAVNDLEKVSATKEETDNVMKSLDKSVEEKETPKETIQEEAVSEEKGELIIPEDYRGEFISLVKEASIEVGKEYGVYPSVMIAQAILESSYGQKGIGYNYFGIKARADQKSVSVVTQEDDGTGNLYTITDNFADYSTVKEGMEAYAQLLRNGITSNPEIYKGTWTEVAPSYVEACETLQGTYATDTKYAGKLITIIHTFGLNYLD